jgi:hypothetical protein
MRSNSDQGSEGVILSEDLDHVGEVKLTVVIIDGGSRPMSVSGPFRKVNFSVY